MKTFKDIIKMAKTKCEIRDFEEYNDTAGKTIYNAVEKQALKIGENYIYLILDKILSNYCDTDNIDNYQAEFGFEIVRTFIDEKLNELEEDYFIL